MEKILVAFIVGAAVLGTAASAARAQEAAKPPERIRGTVEKLEGNVLTVKARGGGDVAIHLAGNYAVTGIARASIDDVTSGKYVGTTTVGERNGALVAQEIHIFPESMRGAGEGHRDWDLRPNSKMTNASVADVVTAGKDRVMTVNYKGGEKKVLIPPTAVVVKFVPADRSALKPGAGVFVIAQRQPDGTLSAPRVNVGLGGQMPPM